MESEISGLADLHAYMKYENYVTCFSFPYLDMPVVASDFDRRDTPEDKLPYDPKNVGADKFQSLKLKPDPRAPALPLRKSPRTVTEGQQQESVIGAGDNRQRSLNLSG